MIRRPPRSTRTDTLLPYTTLFRSKLAATEWKRVLEDFDSKDLGERSLSPDVYAAIRHGRGGAQAVPGGVGAEAAGERVVIAASRTHILRMIGDYRHSTVATPLYRPVHTRGPTNGPGQHGKHYATPR